MIASRETAAEQRTKPSPVRTVWDRIRHFWNPTGQQPYQQPARGTAVTGFIFVLVGTVFWGWVPLLSFIGLALLLIAFAKGNRSALILVGAVLAVFALILAAKHSAWIAHYVKNPEEMKTMLQETVKGAVDGVESFIARVVAKLASLAAESN